MVGVVAMVGYSGTPLASKLGLKAPLTVVTLAAPREYAKWLGELPEGVRLVSKTKGRVQAAHMFVTKSAEMGKHLVALRESLEPNGFVWVSWPKKAAKVATDITEETIRDVALPMG